MTGLASCVLGPSGPAADALVFAVVDDAGRARPGPGSGTAGARCGRRIPDVLDILGASGACGAVTLIPADPDSAIPLLVGVGIGAADAPDPIRLANLRYAAGEAVRALPGRARVVFALIEAGAHDHGERLRAIAEGAVLGAYSFDKHKSSGTARGAVGEALIAVPPGITERADHLLAQCLVECESVILARDLVNEPANVLYPESFAQRCELVGEQYGIAVEVLGPDELVEGGYGGIVAVGAASAKPPQLVRLCWSPAEPVAHLAFVGKGITYDSGGLSLKERERLPAMKFDMAGAAAVLATTVAAARLSLPVRVTSYLPLAENLVGGHGLRPGDVITMRNGARVEVRNTDAEGRLVLADALCRAADDAPDCVVTVATLTGAQRVALGERTAAGMGREDVVGLIVESGSRTGERVWPMPLPEDVAAYLKSDIADLTNWTPGTSAGPARGGLFLSRFIPASLPWAHLDVAGPAYNRTGAYGYTPSGGTGAPTRTLIDVLRRISDDPGVLPRG